MMGLGGVPEAQALNILLLDLTCESLEPKEKKGFGVTGIGDSMSNRLYLRGPSRQKQTQHKKSKAEKMCMACARKAAVVASSLEPPIIRRRS